MEKELEQLGKKLVASVTSSLSKLLAAFAAFTATQPAAVQGTPTTATTTTAPAPQPAASVAQRQTTTATAPASLTQIITSLTKLVDVGPRVERVLKTITTVIDAITGRTPTETAATARRPLTAPETGQGATISPEAGQTATAPAAGKRLPVPINATPTGNTNETPLAGPAGNVPVLPTPNQPAVEATQPVSAATPPATVPTAAAVGKPLAAVGPVDLPSILSRVLGTLTGTVGRAGAGAAGTAGAAGAAGAGVAGAAGAAGAGAAGAAGASGLAGAAGAAGAALTALTGPIGLTVAGLVGIPLAVGVLKTAFNGVGDLLKSSLTGGLSGVGNVLKGIGNTAADFLKGTVNAVGGALLAIPQAITKCVAAFDDLTKAARPFVEALAPNTVQQFDRAMRDLYATIGVALQPIFTILTNTFRQVAGIVLPLMQQLRPVVEQVTKTLSSAFLSVMKLVVAAFEALLPLLQIGATVFDLIVSALKPLFVLLQLFATAIGFVFKGLQIALAPLIEAFKVLSVFFDGLAQILQIVGIVFKTIAATVFSAVQAMFGVSTQGIMDALRSVIKKVIEAFLLLVTFFAKAIGATTFLKNLIKNLEPKQGVAAAPVNAGIKSFEQISKDIAVASFSAAGAGTESDSDYLRDIRDVMKAIANEQSTGNTALDKIANICDKIERVLSLPGKAYDAATEATTIFLNPAGAATNFIYNAFSRG